MELILNIKNLILSMYKKFNNIQKEGFIYGILFYDNPKGKNNRTISF